MSNEFMKAAEIEAKTPITVGYHHTPGPWDCDAVMSEYLHDICMSNPPPGEGNPVVLASVYFDEDRGTCPTLKQANANAKLIAAAPQLLAERDALAARLATLEAIIKEVYADRDRLREACRMTVRAGTELGVGWGTAFNTAQNAIRQSEEASR